MPLHDHLFKSLFRTFLRDLLLLVDAKLAAWLGPDTAVEFRDKELIPDSPEREGRIVDLLAAVPNPAGGRAALVHVEIERRALQNIAEKLLARPEPLAWGLAALAKPGVLGRARVKFEALRRIENAPLSEREKLLLVNCVETYLPLKGRDAEEYASLAGAHHSPENEAMQLTWADKIEAKGRREGRKEGREEAMEQGANRLRLALLRQLDQRFGQVPASLQERLAAIHSFKELVAIAERILVVRSIEELGLGR